MTDEEIIKYVKSLSPEMKLNRVNFTKSKWCIENIKVGDFIIDAGACRGWYATIYSDLVGSSGRVFAFEPELRNFNYLVQTIKGNNVFLINAALSDFDGNTVLYTNGIEAHSIYPGYGHPEEQTEVVTIDTFCEEEKIPRIDHIKTDVEGCDFTMLLGGRHTIENSPKMSVMGEFHWTRFNIPKRDVFDFFSTRDMKMYDVLNNFIPITDYESMSPEMLAMKEYTDTSK